MTRLLLVDDHPLMRKGLVMTLDAEPDLEVVGQAASAEEAIAMFERLEPDVALIDVSLPGMGGLELTKHLLALRPELMVLVVSRHDEALYAERAVRAGAKGYVMKLEAGDTIVKAVRHVLRGGIYLSEDLKDRMLFGAAVGRKAPAQSPVPDAGVALSRFGPGPDASQFDRLIEQVERGELVLAGQQQVREAVQRLETLRPPDDARRALRLRGFRCDHEDLGAPAARRDQE